MNDGGVVVHENGLDGDGWDLGDENAAEGVRDGSVDADEGEGGVELAVMVEFDLEVALELFKIPGIVFATVVAWEDRKSVV